MAGLVRWSRESGDASNADNFATIAQWWADLAGKEVSLAQRLLPASGDVSEIDWDWQRFDENFTIEAPTVRGITLYWYKQGEENERNLTPYKLEFNPIRERLYIYSDAERQLVLRVSFPPIQYQVVRAANPKLAGLSSAEGLLILMRDPQAQVEIQLTLDAESIERLRACLPDREAEEEPEPELEPEGKTRLQ